MLALLMAGLPGAQTRCVEAMRHSVPPADSSAEALPHPRHTLHALGARQAESGRCVVEVEMCTESLAGPARRLESPTASNTPEGFSALFPVLFGPLLRRRENAEPTVHLHHTGGLNRGRDPELEWVGQTPDDVGPQFLERVPA